jgi:hypothetical protein
VSDKRLLKRCGDGNRYLNESGTVSVRPSGLRIRRAEAWTKRTLRPECSVNHRKTETFFQRLSHRATEYDGLRPRVIWNWYNILREIKYQRLNDTSSPNPGLPGERTAGRLCCNRQNPKAQGCRHGSRTQDTAGQNNSNLASWTTSVANGEWELILAMSSHYCFITHHHWPPTPPNGDLLFLRHLKNIF